MGEIAEAGRRADDSDWLDHVARAGLVAFGVVHLVLGWLSVQLALGDSEGSTSTTGAVRQLAEQPFGKVLVWLIAVGMVLLVVWQVLDGMLGHREESGGKLALKRATSFGKAVVYAVIAFSAISVASGTGSSGGGTDSMTATLMDRPGGQILVGLVGIGIVAVGVVLVVKGWTEGFLSKLDGQGRAGHTGTAYKWLGKAGYVAKGVALAVVGGLFGYAAVTHEANKSGGLDQALQEVLEQPFGPVLLTLIGLGFAAYGLFCFAQARHLDR